MIHAYRDDLLFTIQEGEATDRRRVIDTSPGSPEDFRESGQQQALPTFRITEEHDPSRC